MHVNEAHDGYLEVYLNLGWVGVGLISFVLISGYQRAVAAFSRDPAVGSLMLAYVATAAVYSVTEAGFRMLDPIWIFLLFAVVLQAASLRCRLRAPERVPVPPGRSPSFRRAALSPSSRWGEKLKPFDSNGAFQSLTEGDEFRQVAVRGAGMAIFGSGASFVMQLAATLVLARLLTPNDFGVVTMVTTFSLLFCSFGLNGFSEVILQREDVTHSLASNFFWINVAGSAS